MPTGAQGNPPALKYIAVNRVPRQVRRVVQVRSVRLKVGLDGLLPEQLSPQATLHSASLNTCAEVPHGLDAALRLVNSPVTLDEILGKRDERDRGRGVQARQLREPVVDQAEEEVEAVELLQPVGGQVADLAGGDVRRWPVRAQL